MKDLGLTKQERHFVGLMQFWTLAFLLLALLFTFFADGTLDYITKIGAGIFDWHSGSPDLSGERFWLVIASSQMWLLTYASFRATRKHMRSMNFALFVIWAKFFALIGFFYCFFFVEKLFLYFVAGIADTIVFLITWFYYHSALKSSHRAFA